MPKAVTHICAFVALFSSQTSFVWSFSPNYAIHSINKPILTNYASTNQHSTSRRSIHRLKFAANNNDNLIVISTDKNGTDVNIQDQSTSTFSSSHKSFSEDDELNHNGRDNSNATATLSSSSSTISDSLNGAKFGESVSIKNRPKSSQQQSFLSNPPSSAQFGQTTPLRPPVTVAEKEISCSPETAASMRRRNLVVAVTAVSLAVASYVYEFLNPLPPLQILNQMQQESAPLNIIGKNGKPTLVDFWAPWCDNCQTMAATLKLVEEEYSGQVNFVLVNADVSSSWPAVQAFGVDAIPHLALVSADGDVETALIGLVPKSVLRADLDVLLQNAKTTKSGTGVRKELPHQMLDVFANRPEQRKVSFD